MKPFERYVKIKKELEGLEYDEKALAQYLHIAQVMHEEEKAYRKHRSKMLQWLANIEEEIYRSVKKEAE